MKTIRLYATIIIIVSLFANTAYAQFEQKLTLQFSGGAAFIVSNEPIGPETGGILEEIYGTGIMVNGGIQYNFNRKFSLLGLINYAEYPTTEESIHEGEYFTLGIGISAKYKFLSQRKFRPYILYGLSICYAKHELQLRLPTMPDISVNQPVLPGLVSGLGFELDITNNLGLFYQAGFNMVLPKEGDGLPPTQSVYSILGVNLSLFKSKTL